MINTETFGIIGGGEFGQLVATRLSPNDAKILMTDTNGAVQVPEDVTRTDLNDVLTADVVVLAVPFDSYPDVIPAFVESASRETLLVDVCSVKMEPTKLFEQNGLLDRENVLMTHPLFGPQSAASGVKGRNLVVTTAQGDRAAELLESWKTRGIEVTSMSAEEHDREMAKVHVLPFFIGRTLLNMGLNGSLVGTEYYSKLLTLIDVERRHSPELFDTIQRHNPFAVSTRSNLIANLLKTHVQISSEHTGQIESQSPLERLNEFRGVLDIIDEAVPILYALRFDITGEVGDLKAENDLPSRDPVREQEQRQRIESVASQLGLPMELMLQIDKLIKAEVVREHEVKKRGINAS